MQNLSSAAVVIGAVNIPSKKEGAYIADPSDSTFKVLTHKAPPMLCSR